MGRKNNEIKTTSREEKQSSSLSLLKWLVVLLLVVGGIYANSHYVYVAGAVRAAIGILVFIIALGVASQTINGQKAWGFVKGARVEMRKVVWPTRQETLQTTLIVVAMVVFTSLVLWGLDTLFFWLVGWLTGQRG